MKKLFCIVSLLGLTACEAPINRNVYQPIGPRVCTEYYDSFRCMTPVRTWNETIYPKNQSQMRYDYYPYMMNENQSLSKSIYGTYGD